MNRRDEQGLRDAEDAVGVLGQTAQEITDEDVRKAFQTTKWGRRYIYFLWSGWIALAMVAAATGGDDPMRNEEYLNQMVPDPGLQFHQLDVWLGGTFQIQLIDMDLLPSQYPCILPDKKHPYRNDFAGMFHEQ